MRNCANPVDVWRLPRSESEQMPVLFSPRRKRRAIIIGGSMSGLFAAAFLRQIGWDTDVYERSDVELVGRGAGITTHPELLDALEKSGAGRACAGHSTGLRLLRLLEILAGNRMPAGLGGSGGGSS